MKLVAFESGCILKLCEQQRKGKKGRKENNRMPELPEDQLHWTLRYGSETGVP